MPLLLGLLLLLLLRSPPALALPPALAHVDVVYTFVNGSDPAFAVLAERHALALGKDLAGRRFNEHDELRFSMRSLEKFAPWVRNVHIVTNGLPGQIPDWLDLDTVRLHSHQDIFSWPEHLPTFSSPSIEMHLQNIPGLSEYFLYFNDDMFLGAPTTLRDFIDTSSGAQLVYFSHHLPDCNANCQQTMLGDKFCDVACNVTQCGFSPVLHPADCSIFLTRPFHRNQGEFDLGDCSESSSDLAFRPEVDEEFNVLSDDYPLSGEMTCAPGCSVAWVADGMCDEACRNAASCGFDGGDCKNSQMPPIAPPEAVKIARPINSNSAYWAVALNFSLAAPAAADTVALENDADFVLIASLVPSWGRNIVFVLLTKDAAGPLRLGLLGKPKGSKRVSVEVTVVAPEQGWQVPTSDLSSDDYAASLVYTRKALRSAMGASVSMNHFAPAHMPHLFSRKLLASLHKRLAKDVEATSARKFRSGVDVQLAYAYFSYLMMSGASNDDESDLLLPANDLWNEYIDIDGDGCLGVEELRTITAMLLYSNSSLLDIDPIFDLDFDQSFDDEAVPGRISYTMMDQLQKRIWDEAGNPMWAGCISQSVLEAAPTVYSALRRHCTQIQSVLHPVFRLVASTETNRLVRLVMMGDDAASLLDKLDELRARRAKFFTLNDDTVHGFEPAAELGLREFLEATFPRPSRFERSSSAPREAGLNVGEGLSWPAVAVTFLVMGLGLMLTHR